MRHNLLILWLWSTAACTEQSWCQNAPSTKPNPDGSENEHCHHWAKECPCTCKITAAKVIREAEKAAAAAAVVAANKAKRNEMILKQLHDGTAGGEIGLVVFVRSQSFSARDHRLCEDMREASVIDER